MAEGREHLRAALLIAVAFLAAACGGQNGDDAGRSDPPIEFRDQIGPTVDDPDRAMAMTIDAVEVAGDDILVRLRVSNSDDRYLDMGVQHTRHGPLLVMRDDRGSQYDSLALEPAGVPGRRIADLSFRLAGPLDPDATSFTLELATQRGPLTSTPAPLPQRDAVRWRVPQPAGSESTFAEAPRLPQYINFWLETGPLPG